VARISNSIVIVNFNAKAALLTLLKSLHLQESASGEVIVIDCASFDGSVEMAPHFPAVKFLPMNTNRGFFAAANRGIDRTGGDVVVVCHSDVISDIHTLSELADQAREGAGRKVAAVVPRLMGIDDSDQPSIGKLPNLFSAVKGMVSPPAGLKCRVPTLDHLSENEWARFACVAFNRDNLSAVGLMDEKFFLYGGDADLCARIHAKKLRVGISKDIQIKHAGAGIDHTIPSHLMRILRKDQQVYAGKHLPGWQKPIVQVMASATGMLFRSK
jgi:N-acetylglucosaminyl-diphospho-decaprenol L-rhamnosyltransferase